MPDSVLVHFKWRKLARKNAECRDRLLAKQSLRIIEPKGVLQQLLKAIKAVQ